MSKAFLYTSLASLLALTACATLPPPEKPVVAEIPETSFVSQGEVFSSEDTLPDDWWLLYADPVLTGLVSEALQANTDLQVAEANLKAAHAVITRANAGKLPSTDIGAGAELARSAQNGSGTDTKPAIFANAGFAWELDLFGRIRSSIEAAQADAMAVQATRDAVRIAVAAETTRAYLNACAYSQSLAVARSSHKVTLESLELVTIRREAGMADDLDVERAKASVANARAQIPGLISLRDTNLLELAALLGRSPMEMPDTLETCLKLPEPVDILPVGDVAGLLKRRPDIRYAEHQLAGATARIGLATADLYPTINLVGSAALYKNEDISNNDAFSFSAGPLLSWRFPNTRVAKAQIEQTRAQEEAAIAAFNGTVLTALKEVEQAMTHVAQETVRLNDLQDAADRSNKAFEIAKLKYEAGTLSYLDLLVVQSDLLTAKATLSSAEQNLASANIDLFRALGGGWQD